jgi:hypothetical protein
MEALAGQVELAEKEGLKEQVLMPILPLDLDQPLLLTLLAVAIAHRFQTADQLLAQCPAQAGSFLCRLKKHHPPLLHLHFLIISLHL